MKRLVRFAFVGSACTILQIVLQSVFARVMSPAVANAVAFVLSAQVNFMLSYYLTWHDSERKPWRALGAPWLQYNLLVWIAAGINTGAFSLFRAMLFGPDTVAALKAVLLRPDAVAIVFATAISTSCTFIINHTYIFRREKHGGSVQGDSTVPPSAQ